MSKRSLYFVVCITAIISATFYLFVSNSSSLESKKTTAEVKEEKDSDDKVNTKKLSSKGETVEGYMIEISEYSSM